MADLHPSRRFYMVCRAPSHPGAKTEPRKRYATAADAEATARKLAASEHAEFVVLEAVRVYGPQDDTQANLF